VIKTALVVIYGGIFLIQYKEIKERAAEQKRIEGFLYDKTEMYSSSSVHSCHVVLAVFFLFIFSLVLNIFIFCRDKSFREAFNNFVLRA
jgi:hypothetical protein